MNWRWLPARRVARDWLNWALPLVAINIIAVLLSLTVVLLPPALVALYVVAWRAYQGEAPQVGMFWQAMRRWWLASWLWALVTLLLVLAFVAATFFYSQQPGVLATIMQVGNHAVSIFAGLVQFFFWPYMVMQEQPRALVAVRNAIFTILGDPFYTLLYVGLALILLALSVLTIAPVAVLTPVALAFLAVYSLGDWLTHHGHLAQ